MNRKCFCYALAAAFFFVLINPACRPGNDHYDEESWWNAFKKQEVLDVRREKIAELNDVPKGPRFVHIDNQHLYIYDSRELEVFQYSRKDYRLKAKFGRKGEGPSEFRTIQGFKVNEDFIFVNSPGKNSYFSKKGELLKEVKVPPHLIPCYPVGDNFVTNEYGMPPPGGHRNPYMEFKIVLAGPDFHKKKTLFKKILNIAIVYNPNSGKNTYTLFSDFCFFRIYKNNIYIGYACQDGFFFTVFDQNGNKRYEINRPYKKREIPGMIKKAILRKPYRLHWNNQVLRLKFYKYYPSFSSFEVADDRIYIFLYPENDKQRILIMDLKGKLIGVNLVPFDLEYLARNSYQIFINKKIILKGQAYYLHDNEETNKWELWRKTLTASYLSDYNTEQP